MSKNFSRIMTLGFFMAAAGGSAWANTGTPMNTIQNPPLAVHKKTEHKAPVNAAKKTVKEKTGVTEKSVKKSY